MLVFTRLALCKLQEIPKLCSNLQHAVFHAPRQTDFF
jgi:hypothetical protein